MDKISTAYGKGGLKALSFLTGFILSGNTTFESYIGGENEISHGRLDTHKDEIRFSFWLLRYRLCSVLDANSLIGIWIAY